ncbi:MAG TPA: PKD domain-containing protein [Jatrophihabitantaceae bacterium]|nr:PKD domain-containing protein [Jatrophihabitantaceae bacterium]
MGRIRAIGHRRALIGVIAVAALALAACMPANPPRPPVPTAAFSVSTAPLVASFTDQSTGVINSRSWDFGDGQTSTEQSPTHPYATHGVYPVSLTVTGPGGTNTTSQDVTVNPPAPVASFTAEPPSGTVPLTVLLTSTSTGLVDSVAWDLDADGVFDDATGPTATQTFDAAGDHTVGLSVTGPGGTSTVSKVISATLPPPPVASFTALPTSGVAPLTVQFTDTSSGDIASRKWDFNGDGIADATGVTASHLFSTPGSFPVALTVTGPGGGMATATQTIVANANTPPALTITAPESGAGFSAGSSVTFSGTANDGEDGPLSSNIAWSSSADGTLGTGASIQVSTLSVGSHTISASVTDSGGAPATSSINITVNPAPPAAPVAGFTRIPALGGFAPLTVNFTDTSTGDVTSWSWNFGDQSGSNAQNPTHTYGAGGFTITLTVTGPGGSDSFSQPILVGDPDGGGNPCPGRCEPPPGDDGPPDRL